MFDYNIIFKIIDDFFPKFNINVQFYLAILDIIYIIANSINKNET